MVDDPSEYVEELLADPTKRLAAQRALEEKRRSGDATAKESDISDGQGALAELAAKLERERLFALLEQLVRWENMRNEDLLEEARLEIRRSWHRACAQNKSHPRARELFNQEELPAFHDPFSGGGILPLEAQRLGLQAHASDLNPLAVLIGKAIIEIPAKFASRPPVNPESRRDRVVVARAWQGAQGLAEDVRHYGGWMRKEAQKRVGHLYPPVEVTAEMVRRRPDLAMHKGKALTVIAWLWARTVKSPNPAFADVDVPLALTFDLSTQRNKRAWVEPRIDAASYSFDVRTGEPPEPAMAKKGTSAGKRRAFWCLMSGVPPTPISYEYIREQGQLGATGTRLMAIVAEGKPGRVYLPPTRDHEVTPENATVAWKPDLPLPENPRDFKTPKYGLRGFGDLFSHRQLCVLATLTDLIGEVVHRVRRDAEAAGLSTHDQSLSKGGAGALAYAEALALYLAFAVDKVADYGSTICTWHKSKHLIRNTISGKAIPMTWDFAETNVFSSSTGSLASGVEWVAKSFTSFCPAREGSSSLADAKCQDLSMDKIVSTDPPYFDNISYAELSEFFYVWLRRSLASVFPDLFATIAVPKADELVATPHRHASGRAAQSFFIEGMTRALRQLAESAHPGFPVTIYYAFKQSEVSADSSAVRTGWESFLEAVMQSGLAVTGTWPIRTELQNRLTVEGTNSLASSVVLVCRRRRNDAPRATRREFLAALRRELPDALARLRTGVVAPVDLAQAAIGPGMAVYSSYTEVLDASGASVPVGEALALINQVLDEVLSQQEGDYDADSRWALSWFEQHGFAEGDYGTAETLSKAKNTSVAGMVQAGIVSSKGGKVRLLSPKELSETWDPVADTRLTTWEAVHHLIRVLESSGEEKTADLVAKLGGMAETARELCYRLYTLCERKKRPAEALSYNGLVQSWPEIKRLAGASALPEQTGILG